MSYFSTRRTGDIERRLLGARQVRAFFIQSGVEALTSVTQLLAALGLMFFYSWKLALVYLVTVPVYAGLMRFSAKRLRPMYDNLEEAYGRYSSGQIDAIRGIETVKALAAEEALRRLMLDPLPGPRRPRLPHGVPRARLPGLAAAGRLRLVRPVPRRRLDRGRQRQPLARRVRRVQRAGRARDRPDADPALALGPGPARAGAVRPARRRAGAGAGAGSRPRPAAHGVHARRPRRAARRRLPLRRPGGAGDPRRRDAHRRAGRDGRARRAQRLRQDDADQAPRRPAGAHRGRDPLRRLRAANARLPDAPPQDRLRPAGELSLRRLDRRQHRLRRGRLPTRPESRGPRRPRTPTSSSSGCRSASTRASASRGSASPAASSSGSRSRAPSTTARRSCSSTRPRARSTPSRSAP